MSVDQSQLKQNNLNGSPAAATPSKAPRLKKVDPGKEYVAGGGYGWLGDYLRTLPKYIDDITADFGDDLYERMLMDPAVAAAFYVLKLAILSQGVRIVPRVASEVDPDYDTAKEVADFCQRNLDRLKQPFENTLFELLDGMAFGNKVAEQIYEHIKDSQDPDNGRYCLDSLKVKPRRSVAFVVDAYFNVAGIIGLLPGQGATTIYQGAIGDPSKVPNLLPRSKFAVFTFRPKDGDPRGTSVLRPAYNAWWLKVQTWPEYLKYLAQFAGPSLIGYPAEGARDVEQFDADGNPVIDANGNTVMLTPEQYMLNALMNIRNGMAAVFPNGSNVQPLDVAGDGEAFIKAISLLNEEIARAILYQTLATGEGKHNSRAAAGVHENVLDMVIRYGKNQLAYTVENDVLYPLVAYNYGAAIAKRLLPKVSLSEAESHDFASIATAIASLWTAGYLHISQQPGLDAMMNLPERDMAAVEEEQQLKQQLAEKLAQGQPGQNNDGKGEGEETQSPESESPSNKNVNPQEGKNKPETEAEVEQKDGQAKPAKANSKRNSK